MVYAWVTEDIGFIVDGEVEVLTCVIEDHHHSGYNSLVSVTVEFLGDRPADRDAIELVGRVSEMLQKSAAPGVRIFVGWSEQRGEQRAAILAAKALDGDAAAMQLLPHFAQRRP